MSLVSKRAKLDALLSRADYVRGKETRAVHPFIALQLAQRRQVELIAESHSRALSSTARRPSRGLIERVRRAIGEADYPVLDLPELANYPYRP